MTSGAAAPDWRSCYPALQWWRCKGVLRVCGKLGPETPLADLEDLLYELFSSLEFDGVIAGQIFFNTNRIGNW